MDLGKELENSKKEIFRFEFLQEYFSDGKDEVENEITRQFKETGEIDMNIMKNWHDFIANKVKEGINFTWIRLVEFPLNEYTRTTLYIYRKRIENGKDMRVITKEKFDKLNINVKDFYFIDGNVILMNYGKSNEFLGCESDNDIDNYKKYKDLLIKNSVSLADFSY